MIKTTTSTRERILFVAADLFSRFGYTKVSTREIACAAEINAASLYYYFSSKADILKSLYDIYANERKKACPDLGRLLQLSETAPPHEVLMKAEFHYGKEIRNFMDKILITAVREVNADPESCFFIKENILDPISFILRPLLQRMVERKKIKPLDIDTFISVFSYYCFGAAALNFSTFGNSPEQYQSDLATLFTLICPLEDRYFK
ncbi:MAG: TetR/AcrR family transcriptional regulator [Coriobacteriales bacterium]|jgi:AcrR family transcriptional regulator|nr:TetR/AcrR family transcriptional regulator [Coriobacteriales bacterium]